MASLKVFIIIKNYLLDLLGPHSNAAINHAGLNLYSNQTTTWTFCRRYFIEFLVCSIYFL